MPKKIWIEEVRIVKVNLTFKIIDLTWKGNCKKGVDIISFDSIHITYNEDVNRNVTT